MPRKMLPVGGGVFVVLRNHAPTVSASERGLTLVEVVMLILMTSVLGLVFFPALIRAQQKSIRMSCASNLKQIGLALQLYGESHENSLPGPLFPVAQAGYNDASRQELAWFIAENLGCPKPSTNTGLVPELLCPAARRQADNSASLPGIRSYVLNENISQQQGNRVAPFGSLAESFSAPLKLSSIATFAAPYSTFALADADKGNVNPTLSCWRALRCRPAHGRMRTQLFFDGHVEARFWWQHD